MGFKCCYDKISNVRRSIIVNAVWMYEIMSIMSYIENV